MNKSELWDRLHYIFDKYDGGETEIRVTHLKGSEIIEIFRFIWRSGKDVTQNGASFWNPQLEQSFPIESVDNADALIVQGTIDTIYMVIADINFHETVIPDLGFWFNEDGIDLDFESGPEWGSAEVGALFAFLQSIKNIAPEMQLSLHPLIIKKVQKEFQRTWQDYLESK